MRKNKKIIQRINKLLLTLAGHLTKPCIIFESAPPFSDNTKSVFDEFVNRGMHKKYRLIWLIKEDRYSEFKGGKLVFFNPKARNNPKQIYSHISIFYNTKAIICCNQFLPSRGSWCPLETNRSVSFYLSHGIPIKSVNSYYSAPEGIDYAISPGKAVTNIMAREFSIDESKYFVTGYPRNDIFYGKRKKINLPGFENAKIIVWYPTYRQHKDQVTISNGSALPLIHKESNLIMLNNIAKVNNVVVIFKPHFIQDNLEYYYPELSNILFIDDSFFENKGISSYELLAGSDALITDYSSVYFDYTLCDKPIAVVWEDLEDYKEFPGFAINLDDYMIGAVKVFTIEELCGFVSDVAKGIDRCKTERRSIRDKANDYQDGRNSERTANFIIEKARL